ncbi:MAG TPA: phospholipase D-like domain-containing protein [Bryobacteraceae bacterium]
MPALIDRLIEPPRDRHHEAHRHAVAYKVLAILSLIALTFQSSLLLISLFESPLPYAIGDPGKEALDSPEFMRVLAAVTGGWTAEGNSVEVLTNGDRFYPAELAAIKAATRFIHIECYIFQKGRVTDEILQALEERAQAGVEVRLVIDAIGSTAFRDSRFTTLRNAGGRVAWYHRVRWYSWPRANNRTHRELAIMDGTTGFAGGAGFADQWRYAVGHDPQWRDTMIQVEGSAVTGLEATFSENWLEASGEMLVAPKYYPEQGRRGQIKALVVTSSPTSGRSAEARVLLQTLIAKAARSIHITNPYFLPDQNLRRELVKAVRDRGVDVTILVPGAKADHLLTRRSSRALYGDLLEGGARIFEYKPAMIHAKIALLDGIWAVAGSTNFDSRSFGLNDELNVAMEDAEVTRRFEQDFQNDLKSSSPVSYTEWKRRPIWEKLQERLGWLLENEE